MMNFYNKFIERRKDYFDILKDMKQNFCKIY